jgi:hypothetical protein
VEQHIRIAMSDRVLVVWNIDSADAQRSPFGEPMRVVTNANSAAQRGNISLLNAALGRFPEAADYTSAVR